MKKFNITAEDILKVVVCILLSFGIYTCGWINGHLSASDLIYRNKRDVEYVYIEIEKEEKTDAAEDDAQNACIEPVEAPDWPKLYSDEDAVALAQTVYGEARGVNKLTNDGGFTVSGTCQKAAVMWVVLNRYDAGYEDSIVDVCAAKGQFVGYEEDNPVWDELLELAYDVLDRWNAEKHGESNVGRVIPSDYFWFRGDGQYNWFRNEYRGREYWDWTLGDPYVE